MTRSHKQINQPIIFTDDDKPLLMTLTFNDHFGGKGKLTLDFKPMLRAVWRELNEDCPDYTDEEIKQGAANLKLSESEWRDRWGKHRSTFQRIAMRETMGLLQETMADTLADVLEALVFACRFKAFTETNRAPAFRDYPVIATDYRLSQLADEHWANVQKNLNKRMGIRPGKYLDPVEFWAEMEAAWQHINKPLAYLSHLTQEDYAEVLRITPKALRDRIKRHLKTDWKGFKLELKKRLTTT